MERRDGDIVGQTDTGLVKEKREMLGDIAGQTDTGLVKEKREMLGANRRCQQKMSTQTAEEVLRRS